jgi:hypothetical protein
MTDFVKRENILRNFLIFQVYLYHSDYSKQFVISLFNLICNLIIMTKLFIIFNYTFNIKFIFSIYNLWTYIIRN